MRNLLCILVVASLIAAVLGGCVLDSHSTVRQVEPIMRPRRLISETALNGLLVRQPPATAAGGTIEVMLLHGGVASALQNVPGQRRRVAWSDLAFNPYDVLVSDKAFKANAGRDGYQPDELQPISFLIDPATGALSETAPSSWINWPPAVGGGGAVPPITLGEYQKDLCLFVKPFNITLMPERDDDWAIDRSQRFVARLAVGSSLDDVRAPTKGFRSGPWGIWVLFYDRITGKEAATPIELGRDTGGNFGIEMAFTHDSQWLVLVAGSPARAMWVIPTDLPRPEEPWTPK